MQVPPSSPPPPWNWWPFSNTRQHSNGGGGRYKRNSKLVQHANTFAFHCTMYFSCKCVFFKNIIGVYWKLKSLNKTPRLSNQKRVWGTSNFQNLPTAMTLDVTHISKILMSKLDRKTRKQMTVIFKIPYTDLKIYPSCLKFCEILLEQ